MARLVFEQRLVARLGLACAVISASSALAQTTEQPYDYQGIKLTTTLTEFRSARPQAKCRGDTQLPVIRCEETTKGQYGFALLPTIQYSFLDSSQRLYEIMIVDTRPSFQNYRDGLTGKFGDPAIAQLTSVFWQRGKYTILANQNYNGTIVLYSDGDGAAAIKKFKQATAARGL